MAQIYPLYLPRPYSAVVLNSEENPSSFKSTNWH